MKKAVLAFAALRKRASDAAPAKPAASVSFASRLSDKLADFTGSYAVDLPVVCKAPLPKERGRSIPTNDRMLVAQAAIAERKGTQ